MPNFIDIQPTLENYWRSIILFGRNVASYKFALGKSLLELAKQQKEIIPLQDLAIPFARHLCDHLKTVDKQATSGTSRFLDVCRKFNAQEIKEDELIDSTAKLGFNNVIDAFHIVHDGEIGIRFFTDERSGKERGIRLTGDISRPQRGALGLLHADETWLIEFDRFEAAANVCPVRVAQSRDRATTCKTKNSEPLVTSHDVSLECCWNATRPDWRRGTGTVYTHHGGWCSCISCVCRPARP